MKKGISAALAIIMILFMIAALALAPKTVALQDPFMLKSIKVTDSSGYTSPYLALDKAGAVADDELVFVVLTGVFRGPDPDLFIGSLADFPPGREITISSPSLDLSISTSTLKSQAVSVAGDVTTTLSAAAALATSYNEAKNQLVVNLDLAGASFLPAPAKGQSISYSIGFIARTKNAVKGEISATMKVASVVFAPDGSLKMYSGSTLQYTIQSADLAGDAGYVESYKILDSDSDEILTLNFEPTGTHAYTGITCAGNPFTWNAFGKLIGKNSFGVEVDLTSIAQSTFAQLGLSFAYTNYVPKSFFERKSSGNSVTVTDSYDFISTEVTDPDSTDIAETDDMSAPALLVTVVSAIFACAALYVIFHKASDRIR